MVENFKVVCGFSEAHKALFLLFCFLFLLYLENRGEDVAPAASVATGSGWESGEYLGRRMLSRTTNPS